MLFVSFYDDDLTLIPSKYSSSLVLGVDAERLFVSIDLVVDEDEYFGRARRRGRSESQTDVCRCSGTHLQSVLAQLDEIRSTREDVECLGRRVRVSEGDLLVRTFAPSDWQRKIERLADCWRFGDNVQYP